jgi:hypothetical protein
MAGTTFPSGRSMGHVCKPSHHHWLPSGVCSTCGMTRDQAEQERRWEALDASVPCGHTIPGTCDYCGGAGA